MRMQDEDESLRDDGNSEVIDHHVQLGVVMLDGEQVERDGLEKSISRMKITSTTLEHSHKLAKQRSTSREKHLCRECKI